MISLISIRSRCFCIICMLFRIYKIMHEKWKKPHQLPELWSFVNCQVVCVVSSSNQTAMSWNYENTEKIWAWHDTFKISTCQSMKESRIMSKVPVRNSNSVQPLWNISWIQLFPAVDCNCLEHIADLAGKNTSAYFFLLCFPVYFEKMYRFLKF